MKKTLTTISIILFFTSLIIAQNEETNKISLLFLGDIMEHGPQIRAAYNSETKTYNFDSNYEYIQSTLSKADVTIGNLEVTLGTKPYKGYPQFSSPPALATAIKNAGIDILGTANNHSCDRRKKGIVKTIEILDSLTIQHTGTFVSKENQDSLSPLLIEKNGFRIALLNYTYGTNGIPIPKGTEVNLLDKELIKKEVLKAKALQPDQIIAYVHWGEQYRDLPVASQKMWFNYFKSQGVNIVIGSHPHVVEPMYWNKEENSLVVYSLGNFVSNQRTFPRDGGALFELVLTKKNELIAIESTHYILTWVYKRETKNDVDYIVLPIDEFEYRKSFFQNKGDYNKMLQFTRHARSLLDKHNQNVPEKRAFTDLLYQLMINLL